MKTLYFESEMEELLIKNNYDIKDDEGIDSTKVIDFAIDLGFEVYMLRGEGQKYNETLVFLKTEEK